MRTTIRGMTFVFVLLLAGTRGAAAEEPQRAEWWATERHVVEQLLARDVGQWARELNKQPMPNEAGDLMLRFSVLIRAGHLRQVRPVIEALSEANVEKGQLSAMADFLIDRQDWSTARAFLERLPQAEPGWGYVLIKQWAETADAGEIDVWLVARAKANPTYWRRERFRFRSDQGTAGELLKELAERVRRQPRNAEVALEFLEVTSIVGHSDRDLAWMGEVCRPPSAYASYRLGKALRASPRAAIALLEHSLEMPFTKEDAAALREEMSHWARAMPAAEAPPLESWVRQATKQELLVALKTAGETQRAQKLLEELASQQPDGLPPGGLDALAGQIQAASGARVVQQRFEEAEPENRDSAEYWLRRAAYFKGRKEEAQAIQAYEQAMQLSRPDPDKPVGRTSGTELRSSVLSSYVSFLEVSNREASAARLLERELSEAPLEGAYAQRVVGILLQAQSALPAIDRGRLWAYLAARPQWSHQEERLLWRLTEQAADPWERAEALARDRDPSRALVLGWVMTRRDATSRAIPWLKSAWQRLERPEERERAGFSLFDAWLALGDWRSAEELWPTARKSLTPKEHSDWLGRVAVAAARAGAQADALRLWKQRTNLDRASTSHLDEMLQAGLGKPLAEFYRTLAAADPDCQSIEPLIQQLRTPAK